MLIAFILRIDRKWKPPKYCVTDDWMMKMWFTYTMKCYSAVKKNVILNFAD